MKKLVIKYKSGAKTTLTNTKARFTNRLVKKYLNQYCNPIGMVVSAILYTYPLKNNEPLILIENGKVVAEI